MRKDKDFEVLDNISITYSADEEIQKAVKKYDDFIKTEPLAREIKSGKGEEEVDLNGHEAFISIEKNIAD